MKIQSDGGGRAMKALIGVALGCLVVLTSTGTAAQGALYFIHADHLNTPRLVANSAGTTVWKWDQQEPFGDNVPDQNPSGLGAFELPLRLPGQSFDEETNLRYNLFRNYDAGIGRYVESDPMGLQSGLNTFTYAYNAAVSQSDPSGLIVEIKCRDLTDSGVSKWFFEGKQQRHCFVFVSCPEEKWSTVLSRQGNLRPLPVYSTGRKLRDAPNDNPGAAGVQTVPITPKKPGCETCGYEKDVLARYNGFPSGDVPYDPMGPNSNSFVNYLITSREYGAYVPYSSIPNAPGLSDNPAEIHIQY